MPARGQGSARVPRVYTRRVRPGSFLFPLLLLLLVIACGGSVPKPTYGCATKYDCPTGQTCWSVDGKNWECMTSGPAGAGDACAAIGGPAPCGDRLACVATGSPQNGHCRYWCDEDGPCPAGSGSCTSRATLNSIPLSTCM